MKEKYIEALSSVQNPTINSKSDLQVWKAKALNIVNRIYGKDSKQEEQINQITYRRYPSWGINGTVSGGGNNSKDCKKEASEIIASLIFDIETFGLPEFNKEAKSESNGINISLNQNQHQNQTIDVNVIWESIKEVLDENQLNEIKEIVNNNDKPETKKKKILDRLKKFGADVASNIIAGLLLSLKS